MILIALSILALATVFLKSDSFKHSIWNLKGSRYDWQKRENAARLCAMKGRWEPPTPSNNDANADGEGLVYEVMLPKQAGINWGV